MATFTVILFSDDPEGDAKEIEVFDEKDFETLEAAREAFENPWAHFSRQFFCDDTAFIGLDYEHECDEMIRRKNPDHKPSINDDSWRREIAMEAGMLGGCDAFNEVMGY
jgi:hypothetical protein